MKLSTWISVSDLISVPRTFFERIVGIFDRKSRIFHTHPHDYIFKSLKQAGIDGLEMMIPLYTSDNDIFKIRKILNTYQMPVFSIHQSLSCRKPISYYEIEKLCKTAKYLSASIVVLHSTAIGKKLMDNTFIQSLKVLEDKYKIKFGIENLSRTPLTNELFTCKSSDFSAVINITGLHITFDTTHLAQTGEDIIQFFISNKEKIVNIHLSDYKNHWINKYFITQVYSHLPLEEGELPIEEFLNALQQNNYQGIITMEINSGLSQICSSTRIIKKVFRK